MLADINESKLPGCCARRIKNIVNSIKLFKVRLHGAKFGNVLYPKRSIFYTFIIKCPSTFFPEMYLVTERQLN